MAIAYVHQVFYVKPVCSECGCSYDERRCETVDEASMSKRHKFKWGHLALFLGGMNFSMVLINMIGGETFWWVVNLIAVYMCALLYWAGEEE